MRTYRLLNRLTVLFILAAVSIGLSAQEEIGDREFVPRSGQAGKDVIWVPTPQMLVDKMLEIAGVTADDFVIDLGSGDGRTVITAAKLGASALGIEYNPDMVELSKRNAASEGVSDRAQFMKADLFEADFSRATVITMFLLPSINLRLRPKLLDLKPGTRIVSNTFDMEDWIPDETATLLKDCNAWCDALMWIIPVKVEGTWKMSQGELHLTQTFQMLSGTLNTANNSVPVTDGKLTGAQITFSAGGANYTGTVNDNVIEGSVTTGQQSTKWRAVRVEN